MKAYNKIMHRLNTLKIKLHRRRFSVIHLAREVYAVCGAFLLEQDMKTCKCGCGQEIVIKPHHKYDGIPRFIRGHWSKGLKLPQSSGKNHPNWEGGKIKRICEYCGKVFFVKPFVLKKGCGKFCSLNCVAKLRIGEKNHNWKGGITPERYPITFNQQLKDRIRVRDSFTCQKCGVPELECDRRLTCHHIDYDKKNCEESNLISLCCGCNTKVNYNREYWTNYFKTYKINAFPMAGR